MVVVAGDTVADLGVHVATKDIERGSSSLSRRTVLKAGVIAGTSPLWIAPAMSIVGLSPSLAQASSGPACANGYPSHGFVVLVVQGDYYAYKFGEGSPATPVVVGDQNTNDRAFLKQAFPGATVIGNSTDAEIIAQRSTFTSLLSQLKVATYSNAQSSGYTITALPTRPSGVQLAEAYAFDDSFQNGSQQLFRIRAITPVNGAYLFTTCH